MTREYRDWETTYDVAPDYVSPDLTDLGPAKGRAERAAVSLDSVYFDTERRDLLSKGVTLRRRTGAADAGWQLTVPEADDHADIRVGQTGDAATVPKELAGLVAGVRRGRALRHMVTVRTDRTLYQLLDADGEVAVQLAEDRVHAAAAGRRTATAASQSAVARALSVSTEAAAKRTRGRTAGEVIAGYLAGQDDALITGDLMIRRGLGGIHPTRVATRRLRSTLRVFADYLDPDRARAFDADLAWYAGLLGQVRDREVQRARFAAAIAALPPEQVLGPVGARVEQHLLTEQLQHQNVLDKAMTSRRYFGLLAESGRWASEPPLTPAAKGKPGKLCSMPVNWPTPNAAANSPPVGLRGRLPVREPPNDQEESTRGLAPISHSSAPFGHRPGVAAPGRGDPEPVTGGVLDQDRDELASRVIGEPGVGLPHDALHDCGVERGELLGKPLNHAGNRGVFGSGGRHHQPA